MAGMPERVTIGPSVWRVEVAKLKGHEGLCISEKRLIRIHKPLKVSARKMTLLHEVLHAVWYTFGLPDKAGEEETVRALEAPLLMVLRDNPGLRRYLFGS